MPDKASWSFLPPAEYKEQQTAELLALTKGIMTQYCKFWNQHPVPKMRHLPWPLSMPSTLPSDYLSILAVSDSLTATRALLWSKSCVWSLRRLRLLKHFVLNTVGFTCGTGINLRIGLSFVRSHLNPADAPSRSYFPLSADFHRHGIRGSTAELCCCGYSKSFAGSPSGPKQPTCSWSSAGAPFEKPCSFIAGKGTHDGQRSSKRMGRPPDTPSLS